MEQVLRRLGEAAADPPVNGQQGMGHFRRVRSTDLVQILESFYGMDTQTRKDYHRIRNLEEELLELRASIFIPLKSL